MDERLEGRVLRARDWLSEAERVVVGAGSGLSAAAGLTYFGKRFTERFSDFIERYGLTDMYSSAFYPFATPEEKWAYWSRHILANRYEPPGLPLYKALLRLTEDKERFVITTNVDYQFQKCGVSNGGIFAVQGDYGLFQCAKGCHDGLYGNESAVREMARAQRDLRVPAKLVPHCPVCGGEMEVHIRKDKYFVQDGEFYAASGRYENFLRQCGGKRTVLLELGVGFNTPGIIRYPFERLLSKEADFRLIRVNRDFPDPIAENAAHTVSFNEDTAVVLERLLS